MPLPVRMPGMRDYTVMMLTNDTIRAEIWKTYVDCSDPSINPFAWSSFKRIWIKYLPYITVMGIASDLCDTCQNNNIIMQSVNYSEAEKGERVKAQEKHLHFDKAYRTECQLPK